MKRLCHFLFFFFSPLLNNCPTPLDRVLVEKLITSAPFLGLFTNCAKRTVAKLFIHYVAPLV